MRTCTLFHCNGTGPSREPLISSFARLPQFGIYSLRGLHACRNLIFIYSLVCSIYSSLETIWTRFWSGSCFPNYILLIAYYLLEIYLTSVILFDCTLWYSVPDGSLQWSSSVLLCVRVHESSCLYDAYITLYTVEFLTTALGWCYAFPGNLLHTLVALNPKHPNS